MEAKHSAEPTVSRHELVWGAILLTALSWLVGWNACRLNSEYYREFGPFFDSMAYHAKMHDVMTIAATEGPRKALYTASFENNTNCLPFIVGALIGPFVEPSRAVGIWIQVAEMWLLALSLHYFFHRIRHLRLITSLVVILPFFCLSGLHHFNGGLPDFRMDLSLMLLFGLTSVWYLIAVESGRREHFIILGLVAGAAMLFRATAPLYLLFALLPCLAWDFLRLTPRSSPLDGKTIWSRRHLLQSLLLSLAVCIVVSGWFFILNFKYLYYYYVVWNVDAIAKLPLRVSQKHFEFAWRHVGEGTWAMLLLLAGVVVSKTLFRWSRHRKIHWKSFTQWRTWDPRLAWIGLAPATMLTVRGAGLNPFVSMPSAFGLWLACTGLLLSPLRKQRPGWSMLALGLLFSYALAVQLRLGPGSSFTGPPSRMAAYQQAIRMMVDDAHLHAKSELTFGTTHTHLINPTAIENVIKFDTPTANQRTRRYIVENVAFQSSHNFSIVAPVEWDNVPGETTDLKIQSLISHAQEKVDYLFIPDVETAKHLNEHHTHVLINQHCVAIRDRLLATGNWDPVGPPIIGGPHETVQLYRNHTRLPKDATVSLRE